MLPLDMVAVRLTALAECISKILPSLDMADGLSDFQLTFTFSPKSVEGRERFVTAILGSSGRYLSLARSIISSSVSVSHISSIISSSVRASL